ncbi:MAG: hypothetical protein RL556_355 [Actinomycetota bacterium]|jgi:murein DD-endopeptidase MepM/ murein hydrolase activator NlpD
MRTLNLALPPRISFVALALLLGLSSQSHPLAAQAETTGATWVLPVELPAQLVNTFQAPATAYASGHRGLDYLVRDQAKLLAPSQGTIAFTGQVAGKSVVAINHAGGYRTSFEPACAELKVGDPVTVGQVFAKVCSAGYKSHCFPKICLHYGLRIGSDYLSPLALAGALPASHVVG